MLARTAIYASRVSLGLVSVFALFSCGIYGDWFTKLALNHSGQTVIVTASRGSSVGKSTLFRPAKD
jgi:hypothetical protein